MKKFFMLMVVLLLVATQGFAVSLKTNVVEKGTGLAIKGAHVQLFAGAPKSEAFARLYTYSPLLTLETLANGLTERFDFPSESGRYKVVVTKLGFNTLTRYFSRINDFPFVNTDPPYFTLELERATLTKAPLPIIR